VYSRPGVSIKERIYELLPAPETPYIIIMVEQLGLMGAESGNLVSLEAQGSASERTEQIRNNNTSYAKKCEKASSIQLFKSQSHLIKALSIF
jgi:hypothetical protein